MTAAFSARLSRLEKTHDIGNPYAHLTDDELDARIRKVSDLIEQEAGMPLVDYARALLDALESGEEVPAGWTYEQIRTFANSLRRHATNGH